VHAHEVAVVGRLEHLALEELRRREPRAALDDLDDDLLLGLAR
jgi:hypothetical protein